MCTLHNEGVNILKNLAFNPDIIVSNDLENMCKDVVVV